MIKGWILGLTGTAVLCGLVQACAPAHHPPPPSDPPASEGPWDRETTKLRMEGHFEDAHTLKEALLVGEVDTVRETAGWFLERYSSGKYPPGWASHMSKLMGWADAAYRAEDTESAAIAVSHLSLRCGACHKEMGVGGLFAEPEDFDPSQPQMAQYRFAVDRMWEGLVAPSQEHWLRGVDVYASALTCPQMDPSAAVDPVAPHHEFACNSMLTLASSARSARSPQARARAFAGVVGSCAGCHQSPVPQHIVPPNAPGKLQPQPSSKARTPNP